MEAARAVAENTRVSPLSLPADALCEEALCTLPLPRLRAVPVQELRRRFVVLRHVNALARAALPLVALPEHAGVGMARAQAEAEADAEEAGAGGVSEEHGTAFESRLDVGPRALEELAAELSGGGAEGAGVAVEVSNGWASAVAGCDGGEWVLRSSGLLFTEVKQELLDAGLALTSTAGSDEMPKLVIDRLAAAETLAAPGERRVRSRGQSIFEQALRQLPAEVWSLRQRAARPHMALDVRIQREHVVGAAGPYRAFFSDVARELQEASAEASHSTLGLLVPTPNQQMQFGEGRDRFQPRPQASAPTALRQWRALGVLMGVALRTRVLLTLQWPSAVWRALAGQPVSSHDLVAADAATGRGLIEAVVACSREEWEDKFAGTLTWSVMRSDRSRVLALAGGASASRVGGGGVEAEAPRVQYEDRLQWASWALLQRLLESRAQLRALRAGLRRLVPASLMGLCSWGELERRVCGRAEVDLALLRRHTQYSGGLTPESRQVQFFWRVLEGFTQEQRRRFIKFAWGQERLPASDEEFRAAGVRMLLKPSTQRVRNPDESFPRADTCFFNVTLVDYSSFEVAKRQLTAVVNMDAWGLDGDEEQQR